jgi:flavodoxin
MNTTIISYSRTGRNAKLAKALADKLSAKHIKVAEGKKRNFFQITLDLLFKRMPEIDFSADDINADDFVVIVGPVWFGKVASPIRTLFSTLKGKLKNYAFVSISGGGNGAESNPGLADEVEERAGSKPAAVINYFVADFVKTEDEKPTAKQVSDYKLTDNEMKGLVEKISGELKKFKK